MRILSILVMLAAGAALWFYGMPLLEQQENATRAAGGAERLYPDFARRINDAGRLRIESGEAAWDLVRDEEGGWNMEQKAGFPADGEKVRQLLVGLLEAEVVEQKTSNPELYERLGVQDPAADNEAVRLTVLAGEGEELASLVVGDRAETSTRGTERFYVRRSGEAPSWLVQADLEVPSRESDWLDRDLVDLAGTRVQAVEVRHGDGERVYALKPDDSATDMTLEEIPEGKELRYASVANSLASGLQRLTMDDVAAEEVEFDNPPQAVATFWTFDGLKVEVTTHEADEKLYARFAASYDEAGAPGAVQEMGPPAPEDLEAEEDAAGEDSSDEGEPDDDGPSPEEVRAEAEALNARLGSWTFVLPSWKKSTFQKRTTDLVRDIPEPEPLPAIEGTNESPIPLGPPVPVLETPPADDGGAAEQPDATQPGTEEPVPAADGSADGGAPDAPPQPGSGEPASAEPGSTEPGASEPASGGASSGDPDPDPPADDPPADEPPAGDPPAGGGDGSDGDSR